MSESLGNAEIGASFLFFSGINGVAAVYGRVSPETLYGWGVDRKIEFKECDPECSIIVPDKTDG